MEQASMVENRIKVEPSATGHLIKNDDANQATKQAIKPPSKQARNLVKRLQDASKIMPSMRVMGKACRYSCGSGFWTNHSGRSQPERLLEKNRYPVGRR